MHKLYCVLGRSASGKSSLTKEVANRLGLNVIKSYTTRPQRASEAVDADHIYIKKDDVKTFENDIIAYTRIGDYEYFCTKEQVMNNDFYVVDPDGLACLREKIDGLNVELETIYISTPQRIAFQRAMNRGDNAETYNARIAEENERFNEFNRSEDVHYRILNDGTFEESVLKFMNIMKKEGFAAK